MALQPWTRFRALHPDAPVVVAEITNSRQVWLALLNSLASSLASSGEHSLLPEANRVHVAFERLSDATRFAATLGARPSLESGDAARWDVACTAELAATIRALLPPSRSRRAGRSRPSPRAMPF